MMFKKAIRKTFFRTRFLKIAYVSSRAFYHRGRKLLYYVSDAVANFRDMNWESKGRSSQYWVMTSRLLFQYHKLEKGLCIPGPKRAFGADPAHATLQILEEFRSVGYAADDPVYLGAIETLRAYRDRLRETSSPATDALVPMIEAQLTESTKASDLLSTPIAAVKGVGPEKMIALECLAIARRSVRSYQADAVSCEVLRRALVIAQMSPSACNRQPCRVHSYRTRKQIDELLALQNGNRGFGHTVPTLLVLTAEASAFFDVSERNEPYIDGGLFAMSLLFALQAQGVASCCLNWCVPPESDGEAHRVGGIPVSERIIMFIAIGYPELDALVPRSPRRDIESIFILH
ncbi:nitroreductase family protein [Methyloversatilis sp.]|uniref:nitroreductase family protein n=1 Tax=Methyloversatilis sp. TaxID=2569862 RepID=UPI0027336F23|nr:nitroreductase family protein [Methyloversatilis sp.]